MANITEWFASGNSGTLADNTAMASRASGYYNIAQVSAADVVIANQTNLDMFLAVEIVLGSWTPTVADYLDLYTLYAYDGTNYESGSSSYLPEPDRCWAYKQLSTNTTAAAKRFVLWRPIRPMALKLLWRWGATNSTAATGNSMNWKTFNTNLNA
jgi:hypothetical protein